MSAVLDVILIGFLVLLISAGLVLVSPTRRCRRCNGQRVTRHRWTGRIIRCPRCGGHGRHKRLGATAVHRFAWSLLSARKEDPR